MTSSLEEENCQPMAAFCGKRARLKLDKKADDFLKFNFNNLHASFDYEIKISKFAAEVFKGVHGKEGNYFAYLIQIFVKSDNSLEPPFSDINIFFEKDKLSGIIDFYFSCEDFFAFEIAICFNALCFDGAKENLSFNVTKAKNFIDGYSSIRKLSELEKQSIKVLSQGAALRFLLTRVFDALNTVEGAMVKVKDPIEYLKRLEFHKNAKNHEDYFF